MSLSLREQQLKKITDYSSHQRIDEKKTQILSFLLENLNSNIKIITQDVNKDESVLISKLEGLNTKFHIEADKYNKAKSEYEKSFELLFIPLLTQMNCYSEEIEKLTKWKNEKVHQDKTVKDKIIEVNIEFNTHSR